MLGINAAITASAFGALAGTPAPFRVGFLALVVVDITLGLLLFRRWSPARWLAIGRCIVVAVLVLTVRLNFSPAPAVIGLALAFHFGCFILVAGRPGPVVTALGVLLSAPLPILGVALLMAR